MRKVTKRLFVYFLILALVLPNFSISAYANEMLEYVEDEMEEPVVEEDTKEPVRQEENKTDEVTVSENDIGEDVVSEEDGEISGEETTIGTFGDSNGFRWTYDERTYTLTVTGEDGGITEWKDSLPDEVYNDVLKVVFQDCVVTDRSMSGMFSECSSLSSVDLSGIDTSSIIHFN